MEATIKPQDLRIGNLVRHAPLEQKVWAVTELYEFGASLKAEDEIGAMNYEQISPIPLTHELVENLGYKPIKGTDCFINDLETLEIDIMDKEKAPNYNGAWITFDITFACLCISCRYLHELQNLYWAATGEELDVKL